MTTFTERTAVPTSSPTATRVVVLATLCFWLAVTGLLLVSPSLVFDLVGVPSIFAAYVGLLLGCALLGEARGRRAHATASPLVLARPRLGRLRLGLR